VCVCVCARARACVMSCVSMCAFLDIRLQTSPANDFFSAPAHDEQHQHRDPTLEAEERITKRVIESICTNFRE